MPTSLSLQIKDSLMRLTTAMNASDTTAMLAAMSELDDLVQAHRKEIDPRLHHFLERRSYAKALDFLAGATDIPAGTCGPAPRSDG